MNLHKAKTFCSACCAMGVVLLSGCPYAESNESEKTTPLALETKEKGPTMSTSIHTFTMKNIDGKAEHPDYGGKITWNFNKFIVNGEGRVIARFDSRTSPESRELILVLEKALQKEPSE